MKRGTALTLLMMLAVGLTACKPGSAPTGTEATGTVATPEEIGARISESDAPLTLVHIWATWCDPCREEFPEVLQAYRDTLDDGLSLLLVSADDPGDLKDVDRFLGENQSPVGSLVSTELDEGFIETFSTNWPGALPASFFYDAEGNLLAEWQGKRTYDDYIETINTLLKP